jgi:transposase-like protein
MTIRAVGTAFESNAVFNDKSSVLLSRETICSRRRRRWSEEDKGRIVAESFEKGLTASDVARRHDISPQQLFEWRRRARRGGLVVPAADEMTFADVKIGCRSVVNSETQEWRITARFYVTDSGIDCA